ncbi:magnesium transporter [Candidatus Babeliales bacterium]|nr:magnesium transporter [Candidatus Babeliales bacterium]
MIKGKEPFFQIEKNIDLVIKQDTQLGSDLFNLLLEQHPADIAMLLGKIEYDDQISLFKKIPLDLEIKVFEELSEIVQADILVMLDQEKATLILKNVSSEKLADLFDYLPDEDLKKYLRLLQRKQRHQIISRLNFEPDSAGRIMNSEIVTLQKDFTVKKSIRLLQRLGEKRELLQRIYVTDGDNKLVGYINLDDLVLSQPDTLLKNIIHENELCIDVHEDQENVANQMHHYGLLMAPVVDEQNNFLGVITADDVLEIVKEEASEDVYKMSGMGPVEYTYFETPVWKLIWQRSTWLIALLLLQSVSSFIMSGYQDVVDKYFIITMFLTMLIGTGGNAGNQSSALVIRGLATGEMTRKNGLQVLLREFGIAIIMAFLLVVVGFSRVYIFRHDIMGAIAVSIALFIIVMVSIFLGALIPLLLERFNFDPAHSAAPFLATLMDIFGVLIYCFVVSKILG